MIGTNVIVMNQRTLNRAVEHYLNAAVLQDGATVRGVVAETQWNGKENVVMFKVEIEPSPDALGTADPVERSTNDQSFDGGRLG